MNYRYYHQVRKPQGLRRYNSFVKEKWDGENHLWNPHCCPESACLQTQDEVITETMAAYKFPGSVPEIC